MSEQKKDCFFVQIFGAEQTQPLNTPFYDPDKKIMYFPNDKFVFEEGICDNGVWRAKTTYRHKRTRSGTCIEVPAHDDNKK